jgi:predicted tellurium resistance membrane protein TerC
VDFTIAFTPENVAIFLTLFVLEIVLGVDNVIFISVLASKLPKEQQARARNLGLTLAMIIRVILVFFAGWIITLTEPVFTIWGIAFSWKDMILIAGGLFLIYKAVTEIHHKLEGVEESDDGHAPKTITFTSVIAQILLLDIVFSLDSVITAVGMTSNMAIIVSVVILSFGVMLFASRFIFAFVNKHPTVKMLALSFLMLIGAFLVAEGFHIHVEKAIIYGSMAFAVLVEALNLTYASNKAKREQKKLITVQLRPSYPDIDESIAVGAALSKAPGAGAVGLSSKPVEGEVDAATEGRAGLG